MSTTKDPRKPVHWIEVTEGRYDEMMGVLPPASYSPEMMGFTAFQVGEPSDHRNGRPTFASFKCVDGKYYESDDSLTFAEFKAEMGGRAEYHYE